MIANKAFSALAVFVAGARIGANTAIYSFMEAILLRSCRWPIRVAGSPELA